jgi:hypothetical protein
MSKQMSKQQQLNELRLEQSLEAWRKLRQTHKIKGIQFDINFPNELKAPFLAHQFTQFVWLKDGECTFKKFGGGDDDDGDDNDPYFVCRQDGVLRVKIMDWWKKKEEKEKKK